MSENLKGWAGRMAAAVREGLREIEAGREPEPLWQREDTRARKRQPTAKDKPR